MQAYRVVALPQELAETVRLTRNSPQYGHPAHAGVATGYGPCRQCLRTFAIGVERRILFTYDPFGGTEALPLPGPVFIHEIACERYPEDAGFPEDLRAHALTLNAYARGRRLLAQEYAAKGAVEALLEALLARPEVDYIHVRDTRAGCFDFAVVRTQATGARLAPSR